jgi:probable F420-dependent oxidoreductase
VEFWQALAFTEVDQLVEIARCAEAVGFTGVAIDDHLVTPATVTSPYPYPTTMARIGTMDEAVGRVMWDPAVPHIDPWVLLATLAQATTTLRFTTFVYVLPMRDPFSVAKSLSSVAVLSGGRVALGTGVGWMAEEFALTGQAFVHRGRRADEMLEVIARLLRGGMQEFHGEFYDFAPVQMAPVPDAPVPVWIGGHSDAALRRAAGHDGWIGVSYDLDELPPILARLDRHLAERGGPEPGFQRIVSCNDPPSVDDLRRLRDAGITGVVNPPWLFHGFPETTLEFKLRTLEDYAERFIRPLRDGSPAGRSASTLATPPVTVSSSGSVQPDSTRERPGSTPRRS